MKHFSICQGGILSTIPVIAQEMGFFRTAGMNASLTVLGDGKAAMDAFAEGRCDAAIVGEPPIVRRSFNKNDFSIIATVTATDNPGRIVARKDMGIKTPKDLEGKRVGVTRGTLTHYFLDQFIKKNGLNAGRIKLVFMPLKDMPDALKRGQIQAYSASDIAYLKGIEAIGENAQVFSEPGLTQNLATLVVRKSWLSDNRNLAEALLKALLKGEQVIASNSDESLNILSKSLSLKVGDLKKVMSEQHIRVELPSNLLLSLEDQARWLQETGELSGNRPNYLEFVDSSVLQAVRPESVMIK